MKVIEMLRELDSERLQFIMSQISDMHREGVSLSELGNIALRIIMARRDAEEIIEGNYSESQKNDAKKELKYLKDIEKGLVYLYINALSTRMKERRETPLIFDISR